MDEGLYQNRSPINEKPEGNKKGRQRTLSAELANVFRLEEIRAEVRCWKRWKDCFSGQSDWALKNSQFNRICGLCLANPKDQKLLIKFRKTGLSRLNLLLVNSTKKEIQLKDVKLLMWCCLSLLSYFYSKRQVDKCNCFKVQKLEKCKALLRTALYFELPEKQDQVIKYTISYISLTSQWNGDEFDSFVLQELLSIITKPEFVIAKIIKQAEISQKEESLREAFNILSTLSSILENVHWDKYLFNHLLHNCFNTLLKIYLLCSIPMHSILRFESVKLRIVVKTCIRSFITNIRDNKGLVSVLDSIAKCLQDTTITEDDRTEMFETLAYCAQKHNTKFYRESITPDLLDLLLKHLQSKDKFLAFTTHKILQHLLDRHKNEKFFTEPVYFFKGRSNFTINYDYSAEDVHFFKSFFKSFLDGIHYCFLTFTEKYCLISCYHTLCLIIVEVPDPVITINIIHVLITTQNSVLSSDELTMTVKSQLHAIISALVSLICLVHQEEVNALKKYVEEVVRFRTENSPHLLPPLQNSYNVPSHHTVDYHDQLYFLEEEVLYALQRCWLGKRMYVRYYAETFPKSVSRQWQEALTLSGLPGSGILNLTMQSSFQPQEDTEESVLNS